MAKNKPSAETEELDKEVMTTEQPAEDNFGGFSTAEPPTAPEPPAAPNDEKF
jgi:hypothetical protein